MSASIVFDISKASYTPFNALCPLLVLDVWEDVIDSTVSGDPMTFDQATNTLTINTADASLASTPTHQRRIVARFDSVTYTNNE